MGPILYRVIQRSVAIKGVFGLFTDANAVNYIDLEHEEITRTLM
jgi:hypothetical protein